MNNQIPETADAQVWAKEFVEAVKKNPAIALDEETMIAWFSNSIMAGYDLAKKASCQETANREDWDLINERICPNCKRTDMYTAARGGNAENRICNGCGAKYWLNGVR